jgi:phosphoribosylamine---glycine ligase
MKVLVMGSGGREHALCWKLQQSPRVTDLYCAPGNAGTGFHAKNVDIDITRNKKVVSFCRKNEIELVVVGPEAPLAIGIADDLRKHKIAVFGPSYAAARLESSKIFAKELMGGYNIPTAGFRVFNNFKKAKEYIDLHDEPLVVKAYGLASGKGVVIANTREEAVDAAERMLVKKEFGPAGRRIIIEECLTGREASIMVVTDGETVLPLAPSQDHKRAYDGDTGPNTGGMGAFSPTPVIGKNDLEEIMEKIIRPTMAGLKNEKIDYRGVLYAGIMMTEDGPKLLEYNVRFGDPETQAVLPRIKSDFAELLMNAATGKLDRTRIEWGDDVSVCVVLASEGYPGDYEKGKDISGIVEAMETQSIIFHAGTKYDGERLVSSGGRVMNVVGMGPDIKQASERAYRGVSKISFDGMWCRSDIGERSTSGVKS